MDIDGFESLLRGLEAGTVRVVARDLTEPSPMALEVLSARPYAYLDDAPLEERRTQAVMSRRWMDPEDAADIGRLDPEAIARVRDEAWPDATTPDELHDALMWLGFLTAAEVAAGAGWSELMRQLQSEGRVVDVRVGSEPGPAVERAATTRGRCAGSPWSALPLWRAIHPEWHSSAHIERAVAIRTRMDARRGLHGNRSRPPAGFGSDHRANAGGCGAGADRGHRRGATCARGRRLRDARSVRREPRVNQPACAGAACGNAVVRASPARAHSPLHGQATAGGDRTGAGA